MFDFLRRHVVGGDFCPSETGVTEGGVKTIEEHSGLYD